MRSRTATAVVALMVLAGCRADSPNAHRSAGVRLVAAPGALRGQCRAAATRLAFAVPCPTRVPAINGRGMACGPAGEPGSFPPCGGRAGDTAVFFLEFVGFDVGPDYVGMDGKPHGHVTVAAAPHRDAPPCFGTVVGTVALPTRTATEYRCTNDTLRVQRDARHGEGAYVGHLLLTWTQDGIDYTVSAHGHTAVNLALVKRLAGSLDLLAPGE